MKKIVKNKKGVSEIVGVIIMLGIAIALFSVVYIVAMDVIPFIPNAPSVRISGAINTTSHTIYLSHHGGNSLPLNTKIIFSNEVTGVQIGEVHTIRENETVVGQEWNIGEIISFSNPGFIGKIQMIIVDVESNAIIEQDVFQG